VSLSPLPKIQADKRRMGWTFPGASSVGTDFNVSFTERQQRAGDIEYKMILARSEKALFMPASAVLFKNHPQFSKNRCQIQIYCVYAHQDDKRTRSCRNGKLRLLQLALGDTGGDSIF